MDKKQAYTELDILLDQLTSTTLGRRTFMAAVPMLLTACATSQHREREGDNAGQEAALTVDQEKALTAEALPELKKDYPAVQDPQLQAYVGYIGNRIVKANGLDGKPYKYSFTLVDVPMVNAFAMPAGTVFVTAPLVSLAETEAELAGVIGHEIGHVKARHAAERMAKAEREKGNTKWWGIGGGVLGAAAGIGVGKLVCPPSDDECVKKAAVLGAAAGVGGGLLIQKYRFMANSREDEMEADRIGFKASVVAGYSPQHVGDFYSKLQKMDEKAKAGGGGMMNSINDALSTHPPSKERVAQMSQLVASSKVAPNAVTSTKNFEVARRRVEKMTAAKPKA
jgi:beta-barrel assembly-enhancing protease